jgi:hypothetical protein
MRRHFGTIAVGVGLALMVSGLLTARSALLRGPASSVRTGRAGEAKPHSINPASHTTASRVGKAPVMGAFNEGADWSPDVNPFMPAGREVTEAQALAAATHPVFPPSVAQASDSNMTRAWVGLIQGGNGMLPATDQHPVAFAYGSGITVGFNPMLYGPDAPPFSFAEAAHTIQQEVALGAGMTAVTVSGVPVLLAPQGEGGPGEADFYLGTTNADSQEIVVVGRVPAASLMAVATSVIAKFQAANK